MSTQYSKAYLHHLFNTNEILGLRIATQHNLKFYMHLMNEIRKNFFSQRVVEKWNKLPDLVKQADSVNTFKNRLDDVMFPRARWGHNTRQQVTIEQ